MKEAAKTKMEDSAKKAKLTTTTYYSAMTQWSMKEGIRRELMEGQPAGCLHMKRLKTPGKSSMNTIPTSPLPWRIKTNCLLEFILGLRQTILAPWVRLSGWCFSPKSVSFSQTHNNAQTMQTFITIFRGPLKL